MTAITTLLTSVVAAAAAVHVLLLLSVTLHFQYYSQFQYCSNPQHCSKPQCYCFISGYIVQILITTIVSVIILSKSLMHCYIAHSTYCTTDSNNNVLTNHYTQDACNNLDNIQPSALHSSWFSYTLHMSVYIVIQSIRSQPNRGCSTTTQQKVQLKFIWFAPPFLLNVKTSWEGSTWD